MPRFALLLVCLAPVFAQGKFYDNNFNQWMMYTGDHRVHGKWGVHLEAQLRRHEFTTPQQFFPRVGLNYQITPSTLLTAGYAWIGTYRYGEFPVAASFPENRLYQQALINSTAKGNAFQSRLRFEERWIGVRAPLPDGSRADLGNRYQNRFRYQFRFVRDLADPWYVASYNEIFLNVAPVHGARVFDQNRAFVGGGIRLNRYNRLEMGYMQQSVLQRNGRVFELNHTLHVSIYSTLPFGD